jgi:hypothetical protein
VTIEMHVQGQLEMATGALPRRRAALAAGALSLLGLSLSDLLRGRALAAADPKPRSRGFGHAKSCVIVFLKGGPSQFETFDMKPDAPSEIRGEFRPIPTNVPGMQFCEHLPRLARCADKLAVLRAVRLAGDAAHSTAAYEMTTGRRFPRSGEAVSTRDDHPHHGSVVSAVRARDSTAMPFVMVPDYLVVNGEHRGGQYAGLLGPRHDPFIPSSLAGRADLGLEQRVEPSRLRSRADLLAALEARSHRLDRDPGVAAFDAFRQKALSIIEKGAARRAFDLDAEPEGTRERYGRSQLGQSVLLARRLVEAGVRLVHVNCMSSVLELDRNWDTHKHNFQTLKDVLLPRMDPAVASLIEDLAASGLLDETLVVVMGEFGRTPRINENAGRDHWPNCFSVALAGAGIPGGRHVGATDKLGAYPSDRPVTPGELAATIFHALGIDPTLELTSADGRPFHISEGEPVQELWA